MENRSKLLPRGLVSGTRFSTLYAVGTFIYDQYSNYVTEYVFYGQQDINPAGKVLQS